MLYYIKHALRKWHFIEVSNICVHICHHRRLTTFWMAGKCSIHKTHCFYYIFDMVDLLLLISFCVFFFLFFLFFKGRRFFESLYTIYHYTEHGMVFEISTKNTTRKKTQQNHIMY